MIPSEHSVSPNKHVALVRFIDGLLSDGHGISEYAYNKLIEYLATVGEFEVKEMVISNTNANDGYFYFDGDYLLEKDFREAT